VGLCDIIDDLDYGNAWRKGLTPAIELIDVSKYFTVRHERPRSFQDLLVRLVRRERSRSAEQYWVLKNVSFAVNPGEIVGLVGPNGAGKSSVLKMIARIIQPTAGEIKVNGRISALLELGAGFHPDLTGRENVYLNGSILGLSDRVLRRRFDDIVQFAELERFIDVPVRHYSTGMYMRLGFSVAIHADPEVLLVDEVLSVGDRGFQMRCLDRIHSLVADGVAVLFVTHEMNTVRAMCNRAIWLEGGQIRMEGHPDAVANAYLGEMSEDALQRLSDSRGRVGTSRRHGSHEAKISDVQLLDGQGKERYVYESGEPLTVRMHYLSHERVDRPVFGLAVFRNDGWHINGPNTRFGNCAIEAIEGEGYVDYRIEALPLLEGVYRLSVSIYDEEFSHAYDSFEECLSFAVRNEAILEEYGCVYFSAEWAHQALRGEE
jgi:lipopolysaccharide transport system ATP-binding protein